MSEQSSIFSDIQDVNTQATVKRLRKKILTAQIIGIILSVILLLVTISFIEVAFYIPLIIMSAFTLVSILSFKWPFPCLLTLSIVYSFLILVSFFDYFAARGKPINEHPGAFFGEILGNLIILSLAFFIIRGTVAAHKYRKLKKKLS